MIIRMRTIRTKLVPVILTLMLVISGIVFVPLKANAAISKSADEAISWAYNSVGSVAGYGNNRGQCVGLIVDYCKFLGTDWPHVSCAAEFATTSSIPDGYTRIQGASPQKGDILIYTGTSNYPYGHVAIFESNNVTYHQNYNGVQHITRQTFTYNSYGYINKYTPYWGVLRPSFGGGTSASINVSYSNLRTDWAIDDNAQIRAYINNPNQANIAQVGAQIWDSNGTLILDHRENCNRTLAGFDQWLNIVQETNITSLTPGTTYTWRFLAIANGQTFYSDFATFSTSGVNPMADTEKPVITNAWISDVSSAGYTVTCTVRDNVGIDRVQFPTWTTNNWQDDLLGDWMTSSKASGVASGNNYTFYVKTSDHNNELGEYITHIYVWDTSGNRSDSYDKLKVTLERTPDLTGESKPSSSDNGNNSGASTNAPTNPEVLENPASSDQDSGNTDNRNDGIDDSTEMITVADPELGDTTICAAVEKDGIVFRMYNPNSGEHFYTKNPSERDALVGAGWSYEDDACFETISSDEEGAIPVYRVYNPNSGLHHYTSDRGEALVLKTLGWNYEGISLYVYDVNSNKGSEQYRLYCPNDGQHHWTVDASERDYLVSIGWSYEGVAWRVK